jgi:hypothetical protein
VLADGWRLRRRECLAALPGQLHGRLGRPAGQPHCFIRQLTAAAKPLLTLATVALLKAKLQRVMDG